ncbi:MAG: PAS domain-containing protein [Dongiaceae bacterium]
MGAMRDGVPDFIRHPKLVELFRYWRGLAPDGGVPLRRSIDPVALRTMLPHLQLLEIGATPDDLRYRLAGGVIVDAFGFEPTGLTRREIRRTRVMRDRYAEFDRTSAETHEVAVRGLIAYTHDHMTSYLRDHLAYARLNLPVSEDGVRSSGVFGALFLSSDGDPFWKNSFAELHATLPLAELDRG